MRPALLALTFTLVLTAPSQAAELTKLQEALLVEWMVANCDIPDEYVFKIMESRMVIDGSKPEIVARDRKIAQDLMATRFPTVDAGCAIFRQAIKQN